MLIVSSWSLKNSLRLFSLGGLTPIIVYYSELSIGFDIYDYNVKANPLKVPPSHIVKVRVNIMTDPSACITIFIFMLWPGKVISVSMDNFIRGLHSYLGAGAKTSLGVCLTELKH